MNAFDKLCAVLAFPLGLVLILLGVLGLFAGCRAHFSLPPILGVIPAFVGWGIIRAVWCGWSARRRDATPRAEVRASQTALETASE